MERATRAVLMTSTRFTSGAHALAASENRIGLIDGRKLIRLLNKHLGATWYNRLDQIVTIEQAVCASLAQDRKRSSARTRTTKRSH
jgi:restriction endonuclease Mrr